MKRNNLQAALNDPCPCRVPKKMFVQRLPSSADKLD